MTLEDEFRRYARNNPVPTTGEKSWNQMCGSLMFRFSQHVTPSFNPTGAHATAWDAALSSGHLNTDASRAPLGAYHFWRGRIIARPGHVAIDLRGAGTHLGMATNAVAESLGKAIGIQSASGYSRAKTFMHYAGWATNYAGARINLSAFASLGSTPVHAPTAHPLGEDDMFFVSRDPASKYWATRPGEHVEISQAEAALFDGTPWAKVDRTADQMFLLAKIAGRFAAPGGTNVINSAPVDVAAIAAAVAAKLPKAPTTFTGKIS